MVTSDAGDTPAEGTDDRDLDSATEAAATALVADPTPATPPPDGGPENGEEATPARSAKPALLVGIAGLAGLGGMIFGYDQGSVGDSQAGFTAAFRLDSFEVGVVTGMVALLAIGGSLAASPLSDAKGRRAASLLAAALSVVGGLGMALAPNAGVLIVARALIGFSVGLVAAAVPQYISEMAPARFRGRMVAMYQLAITMGIFTSGLIGIFELGDPENGWRVILGVIVVPAVIFGLAMLFMPNTPRWLVAQGRPQEARQILRRTEGEPQAGETLQAINAELADVDDVKWGDLLRPLLRPALGVGIALAALQQLTLINGIIYYGTAIFHDLGFDTARGSEVASLIAIYLVNMLATFIALPLVDRVGRRPLLLAGTAGICIAFVGAVVASAEISSRKAAGIEVGSAGWMLVLSVSFFIVCVAASWGPVTWVMISEIFPTRERSKGIGLCTSVNWFFAWLVALVTPALIGWHPAVYFLAGLVLMGVAFVYVLFRVPETKGRPLEEIKGIWAERAGIDLAAGSESREVGQTAAGG
ncbi:MAG: sugar porter family MFS transporter [Acidimicrobiia bacterium]|nr:sugar porter family MFS transporter [Acidimicrobiia bacterium]